MGGTSYELLCTNVWEEPPLSPTSSFDAPLWRHWRTPRIAIRVQVRDLQAKFGLQQALRYSATCHQLLQKRNCVLVTVWAYAAWMDKTFAVLVKPETSTSTCV